MADDFDEYLRRELPRQVVDPRGRGDFVRRLWEIIELQESPMRARGARGRAWTNRCLAAAAVLALAATCAALLIGIPGEVQLRVPQAGAQQITLARIYAGLAGLKSLRGTLDVSSPSVKLTRCRFVMTDRGDLREDSTYLYDWEQTRRNARDLLNENAAFPRDTLDGKTRIRSLTTYDAQSHMLQVKTKFVDVFTGKPFGIVFRRETGTSTSAALAPNDWAAAAPDIDADRNSFGWSRALPRYLELCAGLYEALRSADPAVHIEKADWRGLPAYRITDSRHLFGDVWVDMRTGVAVAFRHSPYGDLTLTDYDVNRPQPRREFTMVADTSVAPIGEDGMYVFGSHRRLADYTLDGAMRFLTRAQLPNALKSAPLLPRLVPAGFHLASIEMPAHGGMLATNDGGELGPNLPPGCILVYRAGLSEFSIEMVRYRSTPRLLAKTGGPAEGQQITVPHGYFAGFPGQLNDLPTVSGRNWQVTVTGDLTPSQALAIVGSLNTPGASGDYHQPYQTGQYVVTVAVLAWAIVVLTPLVRRLRRRPRPLAPLSAAGWLVVLGASIATLGLALPWYAFRGSGSLTSVVAGWKDMGGFAAATCVIMAAAWVTTRSRWPKLSLPRLSRLAIMTAGVLSAALLAAAILAAPLAIGGSVSALDNSGPFLAFCGIALVIIGGALLRGEPGCLGPIADPLRRACSEAR